MRIERIETLIMKASTGDKSFYSSQAAFPERNSLLVKITTEDGLVGWGEGGQYGPPEPVATAIVDVLAPRLIGRRADQPVRIWEDNYAFSRDFGQKGTYVEAMSAVDKIHIQRRLGHPAGSFHHVSLCFSLTLLSRGNDG